MSDDKVQIQISVQDLATAVIGGITTAFEQMKKDLQNLAPAAKQAGDAVSAAFNTLGVKSSTSIRAEQDKIIDAFNRIKNSGTASADDIAKAQSAMQGKLKELLPHLQDHETTTRKGTTANVGMGNAMVQLNAAIQIAQQAWRLLSGAISPAIAAIEAYQFSVVKTASLITSFQGKDNLAANYQKAKVYAEGLAQQLEVIDMRTIANAQDLALMTEEMQKQRIILDVNNQKQIDGFVNIANAVKVVTQGMVGEVQIRQEIRALMQGQVNQNSILASQVQAMVNGSLKEKIELWKREGTVIENIGALLTGYAAASGDIQSLWSTITSSMETLLNQVLRGGMQQAFAEIVASSQKMMEWGKAHKEQLQDILRKGWLVIKGTLEGVYNFLVESGIISKEMGGWVGKIADGWGMIGAVILPLAGKWFGMLTRQLWDMSKIVLGIGTILQGAFLLDAAKIKQGIDIVKNSFSAAGKMAATNWGQEFDAKMAEYNNKIKSKPPIEVPVPKLGQTAKEQFEEASTAADKYQKLMVEQQGKTLLSVRRQVAEGLISEEEGRKQSLAAEKLLQEQLLKSKQTIANKAKELFGQTSEEYAKEALEVGKIEKDLSEKIIQIVENNQKAKKQALANELTAAQNSYQSDLNSLQEAENNKTITHADAVSKRLKLERDYAEQLLAIRTKELAEINPETEVARYQAALKAKLDAEKDYQSKREKVLDDESRQFAKQTEEHSKEIAYRIETERKAAEQSAAFAQGFFGAWDAAYNNARASLQGLSDAAYNAWAAMEKQPLKTVEGLESIKQKAEEAGRKLKEMMTASTQNSLAMGAAWGDAYKRLDNISIQAQRITAEYYRQKVAAEELAKSIEKPTVASNIFVQTAEAALKNMNLLDNASLDKLQGKIQKIKDEMVSFTQKIIDGLKALQDEWDNMSLSKLELEEKRYQEQRRKWQDEYELARQQGNQDAIKALVKQLELIEKINKTNVTELMKDPNNAISPLKKATGGWIPGIGNSDTVPALLTPGEFVIRKAAASFFGNDFLHAINNMRLPEMGFKAPVLHFATGGSVPQVQAAGASFVINISATEPIDDSFVRRKIIPELKRYEGRIR